MNGKHYIATTTIFGRLDSNPDQLEIKAQEGQTCERVDPSSLEDCLANGDIVLKKYYVPRPNPVVMTLPEVIDVGPVVDTAPEEVAPEAVLEDKEVTDGEV